MKLHQIIAVEKGAKTKAHTVLTEQYHLLQKEALLSGIERVYRPLDEENGERLPPESTRVQATVADSIAAVSATLSDLFDVTFSRETANCSAIADVVVDGQTILTGVPVTYLLFLEKQLTGLHTFVSKLPTLPLTETWAADAQTGLWATGMAQSVRTKKVPRVLVKSVATVEHPAQTEVYHEDVQVGTWTTRKFSGALPQSAVRQMTSRVEALQRAVKIAREEANESEAPSRNGAGQRVLDFVFNGTI
jgi:hypothetical protein